VYLGTIVMEKRAWVAASRMQHGRYSTEAFRQAAEGTEEG
jgi:hypothetical protein